MYQGHHQDGSGVQKHSAGSHYPFIVRVQEHQDTGTGWADVLKPGGTIAASFPYLLTSRTRRLEAYDLAFTHAEALAVQHRARVGH